ncbi:hypothetical protein LCGC14_1191670 [marine sediment metagenome]|uniref:Patatin n=2 Tax=root TaxID=1 RepID=A0A831QJJ5_9FLAO|nr:patatin [Pricia antarctica]
MTEKNSEHKISETEPKIGLVLSGGGIRGVAHIGAIRALQEDGIFPTHISGTSAGAIVGLLYAAGASWSEILDFFKTIPIIHTQKYALRKPGFIDTEKFYSDFKKMLPEDNFKALIKPFFVTAVNLIKGTLKIFDTGEVIRPVLASASFPGIFTPTKIGKSYYVDGGVLKNFPVEPLKGIYDNIIGIHVNPLRTIKPADLKHSYNILERAYKIKMAADSIEKIVYCDLVIKPEKLNTYSMFNMKSIDAIFDLGYTSTKEALRGGILMDKAFYI